jgi:hypothetical protein
VTLRIQQTGEGYEYVAEHGPHDDEPERPVYVHRLCLVAWSDAETTREALLDVAGHDVHHEVPREWLSEEEREEIASTRSIPWLNVEGGLHAEEWTAHRRRTLSRRVATDGGER